MASGANVPISGGTDMQQVVPGDTIQPADFNEARTNINNILSAPTSVTDLHGLNQGGVSVGAAASGATVLALGAAGAFTELQNDIQALNSFYGASTRPAIQADILVGDVIEANQWNALMLDTKDRWDAPVKNSNFNTKTYPVSDTWTTAGDGAWTGTLTSTVTFTWSSAAELNAWFNGGGGVGMEGSIIYSGSDAQTLSWQTRLDNLGDVYLLKQSTVAGAGTNAGKGQVDQTTNYVTLNTYAGNTTYTNDWANVESKVNNTSTPTSVTVKMVFKDFDDLFPGVDEPVLGDTRIRGVLITPNTAGSGFNFPAPSITQTPIVET